MNVFGPMNMMENALDAAAMRQKVISNNIANINTPGYHSQAVAFEEHLRKAMGDEDADGFNPASLGFSPQEQQLLEIGPGGVANVRPTIHQSSGAPDIHSEMVSSAKNQIYYETITQRISGYLTAVKYVLDNSGR
jgi:flagellar basal-body rod protein FlgB